MDIRRIALMMLGVLATGAWAQQPVTEAETNALAAIRAQRTDGLITVQPWVQLLDSNRVGVGWITSQPSDGAVE